MKRFYIVYKTTNLSNGKFYIGSHQTFIVEDDYLGSGKVLKQAIKKYGRKNFKREIICFCTTASVMRTVESHFVRYSIDNYKRGCYNRSYSGTGGMLGEDNSFFGRTHSEETRKKLSDSAKRRVGSLNPFFGKRHSAETIKLLKQNKPNNDNCPNMLNYYLNKQTKWYCTPQGCFYSANYAAKFSNHSKRTIAAWCNNPDKVAGDNYQIPLEYRGKTWRENGYYCIDKIN